jgi:hypothetical protein
VEKVLPAARDRGRALRVFNYDGEHQNTVTVYVATARGKAVVSSSSSKDDQ